MAVIVTIVEGDSPEQARDRARTQVTEGLRIIAEAITRESKALTLIGTDETEDAAFASLEAKLPERTSILGRKVLVTPGRSVITVAANDESTARSQALARTTDRATIKGCRISRKGFLGIGRRFEIEVVAPAVVEVTCKPTVKMYVMIGDRQTKKEIAQAWASNWWTEAKAHGRTEAVCDTCNRRLPSGAGCLCGPSGTRLSGVESAVLDSLARSPDLVCQACFDRTAREPWGRVC